MTSAPRLLPTTVVGSYPQPDWLVNRDMLSKSVPRVRMDIWRVPEPWLEQAQDDATLVAIRDMERAGIDIITDGEIRRESYSNRFATALEGIDTANPGQVNARAARGRQNSPPGGGRGARYAIPARQYRARCQDHAAGPVHHEPAGGQ
jgi:methionine synthase II (cobalamin-independent)